MPRIFQAGNREAQQDALTQRFIFLIFAIIIGVVVTVWAKDEGFPYALFLIDKEVTEGKVVHFDDVFFGSHLTYTFSDKSGARHTVDRIIQSSLPFTASPGHLIEVTYYPYLPSVSEVSDFIPFLETGFWIMLAGVGLIALAIALSLVSVRDLVRYSQEQRRY